MRSQLSAKRLALGTLVVATLSLAIAFLASRYNEVLPVKTWPIWRFSLIALSVSTWAIAVLGVGARAVSVLLKAPISTGSRLVISFGVGVYIFFALTFLVGVVGQLRLAYFFGGPLLLLGLGGKNVISLVRNHHRTISAQIRAGTRPPLPWWAALAAIPALSLASCTLLPSLAGYDATWYHLPLSEQYAHTGWIDAYPEGWILSAYPHMASVIYAWAFLAPGLEWHEHIVLAMQLEFVCECVAWLSIPSLVRTLLPGPTLRWSWATIFLFPAVFYFRPSGGADHFPALWAVCLYFGALEVWPRFGLRRAVLLGLLVGAVLATKYSSYALLPGLGVGLLFRAAVLFWRARLGNEASPSRRHLARAAGGFIIAAGLASAPHWLKNLAFYGDPMFPLGRRWFPAHPWTSLAERMQGTFWSSGELWRPPATWAGVVESLTALLDFSFTPRAALDTIYFGSLFTLSLPLLPLLRPSLRVWGLTGWTLSSIFCWYWLHHQDRYLVGLLPWMSAISVACLVTSVRKFAVARPFVLALVLLQGLWSLRQFTLVLPQNMLMALYSGADNDDASSTLGSSLRKIGLTLPQDAVVLVHNQHLLLGLNRKTVSDAVAWQGGISYLENPTDQGVYRTLRRLGVTHLLWHERGGQDEWDSDGAYLAFQGFSLRHGVDRVHKHDYYLAKMPADEPLKAARAPQVLVALCPGAYPSGIHALNNLTVPRLAKTRQTYPSPLRAVQVDDSAQLDAAIQEVDALLINQSCVPSVGAHLTAPFVRAFRLRKDEGWVRLPKKGRPAH